MVRLTEQNLGPKGAALQHLDRPDGEDDEVEPLEFRGQQLVHLRRGGPEAGQDPAARQQQAAMGHPHEPPGLGHVLTVQGLGNQRLKEPHEGAVGNLRDRGDEGGNGEGGDQAELQQAADHDDVDLPEDDHGAGAQDEGGAIGAHFFQRRPISQVGPSDAEPVRQALREKQEQDEDVEPDEGREERGLADPPEAQGESEREVAEFEEGLPGKCGQRGFEPGGQESGQVNLGGLKSRQTGDGPDGGSVRSFESQHVGHPCGKGECGEGNEGEEQDDRGPHQGAQQFRELSRFLGPALEPVHGGGRTEGEDGPEQGAPGGGHANQSPRREVVPEGPRQDHEVVEATQGEAEQDAQEIPKGLDGDAQLGHVNGMQGR